MPTFCRHNRLLVNCAICTREQGVQMRPVVSSGAPRSGEPRERTTREGGAGGAGGAGRASAGRRAGGRGGAVASGNPRGVRVRRMARGAEDGFSSPLVPGLKSSEDADRLAQEIAFAAHRLTVMELEPVGLWRDVAAGEDIEERTWLAFLIAYIGPHESDEPFAAIGAAWVSWAAVTAGEEPRFAGVEAGPRGVFEAERAPVTIDAYRGWVERAGSQHAGFTGEQSWSAERRFERLFERLALPGLTRDARFELLTLLGRLGVYELRAARLELSGENEATWAAKRALGIGDPMLLERRATELAQACEAPLEALDLAFHNWGSGLRIGDGIDPAAEGDQQVLAQARQALGL